MTIKNVKWKMVFLGFLGAFLIAEAILQLFSFVLNQNGHHSMPLKHQKGELRIMCIGESTTQLGFAYSYPRTLERMLRKKFKNRSIYVINEGVSGSSTEEILRDLPKKIKIHHPNVIITMLGFNDKWKLNKKIYYPKYLKNTEIKILKLIGMALVNFQYEKQIEERKQLENVSNANSWPKILELMDLKGNLFKVKADESWDENQILLKKNQLGEEGTNGIKYMNMQRFDLAINFFKKEIILRGPNPLSIENLTLSYLEMNDIQSAKMLVKSVPMSGDELIYLGTNIIHKIGRSSPAILELIKDLAVRGKQLAPNNHFAYELLYYSSDGNEKDMLSLVEKSLQLGSRNLALIYRKYEDYLNKKEFLIADKFIRPALSYALNSKNPYYYFKTYLKGLLSSGNVTAAKYNLNVLKKITNIMKIQNLIIVGDKLQTIDYYYENSLSFLENTETIINYNKIINIIIANKITPLVMQYPRLELEPLKKIVNHVPQKNFISNQNNFEEALKKMKYEQLFYDKCCEVFGHLKEQGSILVSENIIKTIVELRL